MKGQGWLVGLLVCLFTSAAWAQDTPTLIDALAQGNADVKLRYRYEFVSDDAFEKDAHASTLRTALSYGTGSFNGFDLFLEAVNITSIGKDLYNNKGAGHLANDKTDRPVVADPALTRFSQAFLRFDRSNTTAVLGRHEINIGDQRFVGAVAWRQNFQGFDAFRIVNQSIKRVSLMYAFLGKRHTITGAEQKMRSHLANGSVGLGRVGKVSLYGYFLDFTNEAQAGLSTATYGVEWTGQPKIGEAGQLFYEAEYAMQREFADNPMQIEAEYLNLMVGGGYRGVVLKVGFEGLGGSPDKGQFNTTLGTNHKFNGWADKFLTTPTNGLEDYYATLSGGVGAFNGLIAYHQFRSVTEDIAYGSEVDVQLTYQTPWKQLIALKAAFYQADQFSSNTTKAWLWTQYTF